MQSLLPDLASWTSVLYMIFAEYQYHPAQTINKVMIFESAMLYRGVSLCMCVWGGAAGGGGGGGGCRRGGVGGRFAVARWLTSAAAQAAVAGPAPKSSIDRGRQSGKLKATSSMILLTTA